MKTNYSFEDLPIEVNPKALFQQSSHEASAIPREKRIHILSRLVLLEYDLTLIVDDYLEIKDAKDDIERINHITDTFNSYSDFIITGQGLEFPSRLKSELKKSIKNFVSIVCEKITPYFSLEKLLISYIENDKVTYEAQKEFWNVDIDKDISAKIKKRDLEESTQGLWQYANLYEFFKFSLLGQLYSNRISYLEPNNFLPNIVNAYIKKFFPEEEHEKLQVDEDIRRKYILNFVQKIIEVLWFNKPFFDEPIYLVRCNYKNEPGKSLVPYFHEENIVSICIEENEKEDQLYYNQLLSGEKVKNNDKLVYISRFIKLSKEVEKQDVIVIGTYIGLNPKLGLIKKGTQIACIEKPNSKFYCLKMESVYCLSKSLQRLNTIDLKTYPILNSLIPQQVTISPVNKRKNNVYSIYYGIKYPVELNQLTESAIEMMCMEWLRSDFAPDTFKIIYQIIKIGGNYADIDIFGVGNEEQKIACQISYTDNRDMVTKKINQLKAYPADKRMIFSMLYQPEKNYVDDCKNIYIQDVWNDFYSSPVYRKYLENLLEL